MFIDASGEDHYEKVKNQNELREQDVMEIVETYRSRTEKDKYSNVVTIQEIRDNDYNLNMPRYVDTFEDEVIIDLDAVTARLKTIDEQLAEVDEEIAGYCEELNIATPF
ncbi:type I restriction-modification system DNA-methyltransferase subunit M [Nonlabens tegetincola]|uniref:site-specific DNA-methyltransferase (adenine-specific) n=1 Tax=Nonlabens tegetincola TaxID=323273 RepID=A0A090Q0T3_9FLAO|nr:type I restriction-modification system DNA-methyltransferase subunit M [Nonlabens tegetincola]